MTHRKLIICRPQDLAALRWSYPSGEPRVQDVYTTVSQVCGRHYDEIEVQVELSEGDMSALRGRLAGPGSFIIERIERPVYQWPEREYFQDGSFEGVPT